jgi:hypothetical protein
MEKMCTHILTRIKVAPLLQSDNAKGCWTRLLGYMDKSGEQRLEQRNARWLMWLKIVCRLLDPMFWLALLSCLLPAMVRSALEPFETRRAARALTRHPAQTHPRPVAAKACFYRFAAH